MAKCGILVTGGAGYIGAHVCVALIDAGHDVVVLDNFCNSNPATIRRIERISGQRLPLVQADIQNRDAVAATLRDYSCEAVIHLAGLKAIGESIEAPLDYYDNNVVGTHHLLLAMQDTGVETMVFSSSATVYGESQSLPYTEDHPLSPTNPYGRTKRVIEDMLRDQCRAAPDWRVAILRYFNPVGAHESGLIGEEPRGVPQNLMPFVAQVAAGLRKKLLIFGNDYPTPDGTCIRDYIHVVDLAEGHVAAIDYLRGRTGVITANLGTGRGHSVLDMVAAFEQASGRPVPFQVIDRRAGDVAACWADARLASEKLLWQAQRSDLREMCEDLWRWQQANAAHSAEEQAKNDNFDIAPDDLIRASASEA